MGPFAFEPLHARGSAEPHSRCFSPWAAWQRTAFRATPHKSPEKASRRRTSWRSPSTAASRLDLEPAAGAEFAGEFAGKVFFHIVDDGNRLARSTRLAASQTPWFEIAAIGQQ